MKNSTWKAQNSFTHAGVMQMRRRVNGNRLEANYPVAELQAALRTTLVSCCLLSIVYAELLSQPTIKGDLERIHEKLTSGIH